MKHIARSIYYWLRRHYPQLRWLSPNYWPNLTFSQDGEDVILERLFKGHRDGFYVDIGAFHPRAFSNTHRLHKKFNWKGVNIDPMPEAIRRFERVRKNDINLQLAVGEEESDLVLYCFEHGELNTLSEQHAQAHAEFSARSSQITVKQKRLDWVLSQYLRKGDTIDLLDVDAEGRDLQVLRSNDWSKYRPRVISAECLYQTVTQLETHPVHVYLVSQGYELIAKTLNTCIYAEENEIESLLPQDEVYDLSTEHETV